MTKAGTRAPHQRKDLAEIEARLDDAEAKLVDSQSTAVSLSAYLESSVRPLVEVQHLHVDFQQQHVLRNIDLSVPRGQTVAIIGESGCGKTVLLKAIISLIRPTSGQVHFDGKNLAQLNEIELTNQRMRFGFLFQNAALFDSMTVGKNIAFPLRQRGGFSESKIRETVLARLADVGLSESVIRKKPAELSGGMRKRVGLARALVMDPELLLYDEPTTGLDPIMSDVINELILRTRRRHPVTSIIVTHDMRTAHKVADRVVMIHPLSRLGQTDSQIIFDGPPHELAESDDSRVLQFVQGEAGERLLEMREAAGR